MGLKLRTCSLCQGEMKLEHRLVHVHGPQQVVLLVGRHVLSGLYSLADLFARPFKNLVFLLGPFIAVVDLSAPAFGIESGQFEGIERFPRYIAVLAGKLRECTPQRIIGKLRKSAPSIPTLRALHGFPT